MTANVGTETLRADQCVSCGAPLSGPYCARCGERVLEPEALTLRHFLVHTVAHELLHFDGALWRTLHFLFLRPGRLSLEYAAGRRRPYVNPFRLLLIAIVAYTLTTSGFGVTLSIGPLTLSLAPPSIQKGRPVDDVLRQVDRYGLLQRQLAAKQQTLEGEAGRERFQNRLEAFVEPASFTNVFLLAAVLHFAFWRQRRPFLEHAAFSMHVFSFVLLSTVILSGAFRLRHWLPVSFYLTILVFALWQFAYLAVAVRRFYLTSGGWSGRLLSVVAAMLIYVVNAAFITAVQVAGAALALALA